MTKLDSTETASAYEHMFRPMEARAEEISEVTRNVDGQMREGPGGGTREGVDNQLSEAVLANATSASVARRFIISRPSECDLSRSTERRPSNEALDRRAQGPAPAGRSGAGGCRRSDGEASRRSCMYRGETLGFALEWFLPDRVVDRTGYPDGKRAVRGPNVCGRRREGSVVIQDGSLHVNARDGTGVCLRARDVLPAADPPARDTHRGRRPRDRWRRISLRSTRSRGCLEQKSRRVRELHGLDGGLERGREGGRAASAPPLMMGPLASPPRPRGVARSLHLAPGSDHDSGGGCPDEGS